MLMTVLRSDLAVKQSKDFVRTFKKMKDYILGNQNLIGQREVMQLSMQTAENTTEISRLSEGGTHDRSNLIALCKSCHSRIHAERGDRWHNKTAAP